MLVQFDSLINCLFSTFPYILHVIMLCINNLLILCINFLCISSTIWLQILFINLLTYLTYLLAEGRLLTTGSPLSYADESMFKRTTVDSGFAQHHLNFDNVFVTQDHSPSTKWFHKRMVKVQK